MLTGIRVAGVAIVVLVGIVAFAGFAHASPPCADQVIRDWSDNGRVDRVYRLICYDAAIDDLAPDLRDYTDARDVIARALMMAVRVKSGATSEKPPAARQEERAQEAAGPIDTSSSWVPMPLLVLAGLGLAVLAAGALSYVGRRAALGRREPRG